MGADFREGKSQKSGVVATDIAGYETDCLTAACEHSIGETKSVKEFELAWLKPLCP